MRLKRLKKIFWKKESWSVIGALMIIGLVSLGIFHTSHASGYGGGIYTNICGSAGQECSGNNCNSLYRNCEADCKPDSGYCQAKSNEWAFKHVCNGESSESCPNGLPEAKPPKVVQGGKVTVDGDGVKCNQTVQLDIHTVDCRVTSCSMSTLKGYLLWYSGACPQVTPSNTPTKTPTKTPTGTQAPTNTPTKTPTGTRTPTSTPTRTPTGNPPTATPRPPTATQSPPTATPTPDFNEAMCKCDGMTVSQIIAGQPAVFTANAKVTGSDTSKAEAKQIEFLLSAGNDPTTRKIIAGPQRVNTTASGNATEMKYQAQWTVNIPSTVQKGVDYVAKATIKCTRKTTAQAYPYTAMVLGEVDRKSIFSVVADFFRNLFSGETDSQVSVDDAQVSTQQTSGSNDKKQLQLGTFVPATVVPEAVCSEVRFRFSQ
jgi:hypothetical protein